MAITIQTWKEKFIHKYKDVGFNYFGYFDHNYQVLFKKKLSDDLVTVWFNAYVKLEEPLKGKYEFESYRDKNIVGCDTSDHTSKSDLKQCNIIRDRINSIINEHYEN